jgi:hypothetical protein
MCSGISGGHINPAVRSILSSIYSASKLPYAGYALACCLSWFSLEEGACVYVRTGIGRNVWRSYHLCELLPRNRPF